MIALSPGSEAYSPVRQPSGFPAYPYRGRKDSLFELG
jgi:hypothetical protein